MEKINHCALCQSPLSQTDSILDLPDLPLSETFGTYNPAVQGYDQSVLLCGDCGHVQLLNQLSPEILYSQNNYHYETGKSVSTPRRFLSFSSFVNRHCDTRDKTVMDIGGNDASLINQFEAKQKVVIDPGGSCRQEDNISVINGLVEDVDLAKLDPAVVLCSHTLEHIKSPANFIRQLLEQCKHETRFFFEVPCVQKQIEGCRFDAFFHQHYHYFQPATLKRLLHDAGAEIIEFQYNEYPTCGGSVMFCFKKSVRTVTEDVIPFQREAFVANFQAQYARFRHMNKRIAHWIESRKKVYGYGGSLLLPVIFYHIGEASKSIICVLDDDAGKAGLTYKNLKGVTVSTPDKIEFTTDDGLLITSYENVQVLRNAAIRKFNVNLFDEFIT